MRVIINTQDDRVCIVHYNIRDPETIWATPRPTCSSFRCSFSVKKNRQDNKYPRP